MKNSNKGFTLAEVLITLGIIGVVAALTIPTLMQNANERATVTALKKAYSTLSNAYSLAVKEDGTPDNWGLTVYNSPQILGNLKPYLKVDKDCTDGSQGCFSTGIAYIYLAASLGGDEIYDNAPYPKLKLTDGTSVAGYAADPACNFKYGNSPALQNICGNYWVDINGYKKPNQWGKDLFMFYITKHGIIPWGTAQQTAVNGTFADTCKDKDSGTGWGCTAWVIYNDNMDYLHCNNLAWGGPTKCN